MTRLPPEFAATAAEAFGKPERKQAFKGGRMWCSGNDGCGLFVADWALHMESHKDLDDLAIFNAQAIVDLFEKMHEVSTGALDYSAVHRGDQPPYSPKGTDDRNASSATDEPAREGEGMDPPAGGVGPRRDRGPSGNGGGPVTPEGV